MLRSLLVLQVWLLCHGASSANASNMSAEPKSARSLQGTQMAELALIPAHTAQELELFWPAGGFGWQTPSLPGFSSITDMVSKGTEWVADAGKRLADQVINGPAQVVAFLQEAKKFLEDGVIVANTGWDSMEKLAKQLTAVYNEFKPLKPVFASDYGFTQLVTSKANLHRLITCVLKLFDTSEVLDTVSEALQQVSGMFKKFVDFFEKLLGKLQRSRMQLNVKEDAETEMTVRRLMDVKKFLQDLNFRELQQQMTSFANKFMSNAKIWKNTNATLGPLLQQLDGKLKPGRALASVGFADTMKRQKEYEKAIKPIVGAWQTLEKDGMAACPYVIDAVKSSKSLACRVNSFITNLGGTDWEVCLKAAALPDECPKEALSADVKDLLSKNAGKLAWLLAIAAGAIACCGGGYVAYNQFSEEEEDKPEDQTEMT